MSLFTLINEDLKKAMKAGEKEKVGIFRMILSDIKKIAIDLGTRDEISDELVNQALVKGVKSRKESVTQYRAANREDLAVKEEAEIEVLSVYLPKSLEDNEISEMIQEAIQETQASGKKDMGKVMKAVMPKIMGRADGKKVQQMVMDQLNPKKEQAS